MLLIYKFFTRMRSHLVCACARAILQIYKINGYVGPLKQKRNGNIYSQADIPVPCFVPQRRGYAFPKTSHIQGTMLKKIICVAMYMGSRYMSENLSM